MSRTPVESALLRWFGEFAEHGILTTDERLVLTGWNRWLERRTGRPAGETVGRPLLEAYPDLKARGLDELYRGALAGRAHLVSFRLHGYLLPIPARAGEHEFTTMPQRARIAPLTADDRIVGTITVIDDVSERVASEQELRRQIQAQEEARRAAEEALRMKDEFLATLSHEMRTPLNAVLGWARILTQREIEPELLSRGLQSILRNATMQARLIDDLLDTARIMTGKLRLNTQPVDLVPVALAACDVLSPVLEAKRLELQRTLDPALERVLGDPDRLQQVIWNLLTNAAKFTEPGGRIEFRLEQSAGRARIVVRDTGRGIDPEFLPYVFDRFRQGDTSASRGESGLGLGLALVRDLVELHGGTVTAVSQGIGHGATFVVDLPAIASGRAAAPESRSPEPPPGAELRGVHVLVIEDEDDARDLLATILSGNGAGVTAVRSAAEAMRHFAEAQDGAPAHVVVADIGMAGEDGYELIRRIRQLPPAKGGELPAVAVTAYARPEDRARALAAGYQAHFAKPVEAAALVSTIVRLVRRADV